VNHVVVELSGTSPIVHNRCRSDGTGWLPKDDLDQAGDRLFADADGSLYLPWWTPSIAVGRAAHSKGVHGANWPMSIVHAATLREVLRAVRVDFDGDWTPQVFLRRDLPLVALPRFDRWSASFTLDFDPKHYRADHLRELLEHSGRHVGLPQFAPFAGKGPWGRFEVSKWEPVASVAAA